MSALTNADVTLPAFEVWDITTDNICIDVGTSALEDISDREALAVLYKLRRVYASRLKKIIRELERLEQLNESTEYKDKDLTESMLRAERWRKQTFPRELDIALHKNGIIAS